MEFLILILIGFLIAIVVLPSIALARANSAKRGLDDLVKRLSSLEKELRDLQAQSISSVKTEAPATAPAPITQSVAPLFQVVTAAPVASETAPGPPPIPAELLDPSAPKSARPVEPPIDWEQFMGAKLFAWIGGLALFLGVAFFVKYSFEHDLIPPEVRVALGFLVGIGLVAGGMVMRRKDYSITAHTLCATGILILYAVTFACRAGYHFPFFGPVPTFILMTLVTAAAFLLAVRLEAQVLALLGMLGGFLTPVLLSTGQ